MLELKSKAAHRKKIEPLGSLSGGFREAQKSLKCPNISVFGPPLKSHSDIPLTQFFFWGQFLSAFQAYFNLKAFKDHLSLQNVNFRELGGYFRVLAFPLYFHYIFLDKNNKKISQKPIYSPKLRF